MPLPEERLDAAGLSDEVSLDLLEEYRAIGVFFRIGGKRPTLYSFLKQAGVALPDNPSDQRRLYEGGRDSLLAKYTAKFVDRPPVFWETTLTPDVAQSRLIGDIDQTILEVAADPDAAWAALREKGLTASSRHGEGAIWLRGARQLPDGVDPRVRDNGCAHRDLSRLRRASDFPLKNRLPTTGGSRAAPRTRASLASRRRVSSGLGSAGQGGRDRRGPDVMVRGAESGARSHSHTSSGSAGGGPGRSSRRPRRKKSSTEAFFFNPRAICSPSRRSS